jgi:uncharacterized membrane protein
MDNKQIGIILIVIPILLGIGLVFTAETINKVYTDLITKNVEDTGTCFTPEGVCLHEEETKAQIPIIILSVILVGILAFGIYLTFKKEKVVHHKKTKVEHKTEHKLDLSRLTEEEKKIVHKIKEAEGSIYQSKLVDETMTKVKVTRILDKLEGKGIIERKRRGMTNIVILKH